MVCYQFRHWCFTSFEIQAPVYSSEIMTKLMYQKERCPTSGTIHWQGFVTMKMKCTLKKMKELFGDRVHFEGCRGNYESNVRYCSKSESCIEPPVYNGDCKPPDEPPGRNLHPYFVGANFDGHPNQIIWLTREQAFERFGWAEAMARLRDDDA